jgi:NADP-dependent 3-hydroxy acid dehydrogenase YdfG
MMGDMHEQLSGVDILVNNAGIQYVSAVHEFPEDKWWVYAQHVVLTGKHNLCSRPLPHQ